MFTKEIANRIIFMLSWLNRIGTFPLKFNLTRGHLFVDFRCHFRTIYIWIWATCYCIIVLPTHMYTLYQRRQFEQLSYTLLLWLGGLTATTLLRVFALKALGLCQLFNASFKFLETFSEKFMRDYKLTKNEEVKYWIFEKCIFACFCICSLIGALIGLDFFLHPQAPPYPLFEVDPRFLSWPVLLISGIWFSSIATGLTATFGFVVYGLAVYFAGILVIIKNEVRLGKQHYKSSNILRIHPFTLMTTWRSIEIIVIMINNELTYNFLIYIQGGLTTCIVFSMVTLTFHWKSSGTIVRLMMITFGLASMLGYSAVLQLAGLKYKWSEQTIRSWKRQYFLGKDWLYVKKFKLSCRPLCIGDGRRYVVRPKTILLFFRSVTSCTFKTLLTYRSLAL